MRDPKIPDPKEAVPFGEALKAFRKRESAGQGVIADLCGVSQGLVSHWESGAMPIAPACYEKLCALSPDLAAALPPEFTTRSGRPTKAETRKPAAAKAPVPPKANGSNGHRAAPLDGLRLAARALGIVGPLTITVDDAESEVRVGAEQWPGASPDEAVETARKALDDRLRDLLRRVEAARASLGGAL